MPYNNSHISFTILLVKVIRVFVFNKIMMKFYRSAYFCQNLRDSIIANSRGSEYPSDSAIPIKRDRA